MTMNYDELAQAALACDETAVSQLVEAGVDALPAILAALPGLTENHGLLPLAVERICRSAPVDVVLQVVDFRRLTAFEAGLRASLGRQEVELRQGLLDRLHGDLHGNLQTKREGIAEFFGNRGDTSVIPALREVFAEASRGYRLKGSNVGLAVASAEALAKLGDFSAGGFVVEVLADSYSPTRELAAEALSVAVGPGMTRALILETEDSRWDSMLAAVRALFLLRDVAAVDALVEVTARADPSIAYNAVVGINDIIGTEFSVYWSAEQVADRWNDHRQELSEGVHYRLGKPLRVTDLFDILANDPGRHDDIVEEIQFTTGVAPVDGSYPPETAAAVGARFPSEGTLYRWGHQVDLGALGR